MHFLLFALCCAAFAACTDEDDASLLERAEVQFTSSLLGDEPVATRVYDTSWTGGETVGVTMVDDGKAYNGEAFTQYTAKSSGSSTDFTAVGTGLYYPINPKDKVNFIAYSPYVEGATNTVTYKDMHLQSNKPSMESKDFIHHKGTTAYNRTTIGKVELDFTHKLSKLVINVERATGVSESMKKLVVTVGSIPQSATCTLSDGSVTEIGDTKILEPWQNDSTHITTDTKTRFEAIVAPHDAASHTVTFKVMNSSGVEIHTYTKTISDAFISGKRHIYNFKVTAIGVALEANHVVDWGAGDTSWYGPYSLSVLKSEEVHHSDAATYTLQIRTNSPTSPSVDGVTSTGGWLSTTGSMTPGSNVTVDGKPFKTFTQSYQLTKNDTGTKRDGTIRIRCGEELSVSVPISQDETMAIVDCGIQPESNCYIVRPHSTILIPMSRVNDYHTNYYDEKPATFGDSDAFTTDLLWSDVKDIITHEPVNKGYSNGYVRVTTPTNYTGNAVVVAKNTSGTILWSWHIWVVNNVGVKSGGDFLWLDRNLGATSATPGDPATIGCYYQWGRKDPFPGPATFADTNRTVYLKDGSSTTAIDTDGSTSKRSITYSIQSPHQFVTVSGGDWCSTDQSTSKSLRWYNVSSKAIDDPCPPGYMVPLDGNWSFLNTTNFTWNITNKGRFHSTAGYYPAAGNRDSSDGSLSTVGSTGHYWSATRYSTSTNNAYILYFYSDNLDTSGGYRRSRGFGVRCRQE